MSVDPYNLIKFPDLIEKDLSFKWVEKQTFVEPINQLTPQKRIEIH